MSIFVCGSVNLFKGIVSLFLPLRGFTLAITAMAISSVLIYILIRLMGRMGGILLTVVGAAGAFFTGGTSLILMLLGLLITFFERMVILIIGLNVGIYLLCIFVGCA